MTQDGAGGRHYSDLCEPSIKFSTVFQPWFWPGLSFSVSVSSFVWTTADLNIIFVCGSIDFFFLSFNPLVRNNFEGDDLNRA